MKKKMKVIVTMILFVFVIAVVIICARKMKLVQNEKYIIGTWGDGGLEDVITVQDNGILLLNRDMPDVSLSCGNASYYFSYTDTICVTQGDVSVEYNMG